MGRGSVFSSAQQFVHRYQAGEVRAESRVGISFRASYHLLPASDAILLAGFAESSWILRPRKDGVLSILSIALIFPNAALMLSVCMGMAQELEK